MNKPIHVLLQKDAHLEEWSDWSPCSISCIREGSSEFGVKSREANCIEGMNGGTTCIQLIGHRGTKKGVTTCVKEIEHCPINHSWTSWTLWSECPLCFEVNEQSNVIERKRERVCIDGRHGGSSCPSNVK